MSRQVPDSHLFPDAIIAAVILLYVVTVSLAICKLKRWPHVLLNLRQRKKAAKNEPPIQIGVLDVCSAIISDAFHYPLRLGSIQARLPLG